jgi:hypothetical protein
VKPKTQNQRLEPTGQAKTGATRRLMSTGPDLASQLSAGQVFGRVRNQTNLSLRSKPGPLAGYLDSLLTLVFVTVTRFATLHCGCIIYVLHCIYSRPIWLQIIVEHIWRSIWTHPLSELRDTLLRGCCGEAMKIEDREPTINTLP